MARAMVLEYQEDPNVWSISDQYMFGNSLMIAPIYNEEGAVIPKGPVMNYVDQIITDNIELLIAPFEKDGETNILVPVDAETVKVNYKCCNGEHTVEISNTNVRFSITSLNQVALKLVISDTKWQPENEL